MRASLFAQGGALFCWWDRGSEGLRLRIKAAHELGDDCTGKVWYEWMLDVDGVTSPIHNPLGRSNWIGL